jgi:hypothetical protein
MPERPSDAEVFAAARVLYDFGMFHSWWPSNTSYEGLDPIGRSEFDYIVERVLLAAATARDQSST